MHEVLVNRLGGLSLPRKSVVRLTDRPDMTLDVYRGHKTTMQQATTVFFLCVNIFKTSPPNRLNKCPSLSTFSTVLDLKVYTGILFVFYLT